MLCCLAVQLQGLVIGVTTKVPESGPVPHSLGDIDYSDQYWHVVIRIDGCTAWHKGQRRELQWLLDDSVGNTFGCHVSGTGELHLYHNGRDVGVAWKGLSTDQPLSGFVDIGGRWKVEANYVIPKGETVWCDVVCDRMFVSLYICTCSCHFSYFALHMTVVRSDRYSLIHSVVPSSIL